MRYRDEYNNPNSCLVHSKGIQRWQIVSTMLKIIDVLIVNGAYYLALWIRFDFRFSLIENQFFER